MSTTSAGPQVTNKSTWKQNAKHTITLPSSSVVEIVIPDLARMIETDQIPQNLLDAALAAAGRQQHAVTKESIIEQRQFTDKLVQLTVVNPKLTDEDLVNVPFEDKELIVEIATRQRDLDALGDHIGGLETSEKWRSFRGFASIDQDVASL